MTASPDSGRHRRGAWRRRSSAIRAVDDKAALRELPHLRALSADVLRSTEVSTEQSHSRLAPLVRTRP